MSVHAGSIWIDNNLAEAPKDKWLAVAEHGIVEQNEDIVKLYADLEGRSIGLGTITIAFLPGGIRQ